MNNLEGKKILLIICGGIAAYKSLELIRILRKNNVHIKTILTKNAHKFVTPLSVTSLSNEKVYSELFNHENEAEMDHIALSRWADVILIAPATANTISKLSYGLADELASTVVLASDKNIILAPAMNVRMWEHQSNKDNIKKLIDYGYKFIGPEIGDMACGEFGEGKMSEPEKIFDVLKNYFSSSNKKFRALVTSGPTREYIDPIRFISNKSSGKQGHEIAKSLRDHGFETTLISGPTNLKKLDGIKQVNVETADQMFKKTLENLPVDVAIFSAAVSDWKIKDSRNEKIKKDDLNILNLEKNRDILSYVSKHNSLRPKIVIGFSAETNDLIRNSQKKLDEKNCDWIIANNVSNNSFGLDSDFNEISIITKKNKIEKISKNSKKEIADKIVKKLVLSLN
tara:strand:- start:1671 stop:2864 length:1194 start_codon:yes stop_codon:yes gene_type:complete